MSNIRDIEKLEMIRQIRGLCADLRKKIDVGFEFIDKREQDDQRRNNKQD